MCNKRSTTSVDIYRPGNSSDLRFEKTIRVDQCISDEIYALNAKGRETLGSCCGHGRYNKSIIYRSVDGTVRDLVSGIPIRRERRFYVTDRDGYYFLPELYRNVVPRAMLRREEKNSIKYYGDYKDKMGFGMMV